MSRILWFNIGVALGQIAALVVMGIALSVWRGTPGWKRFSVLANSVLIAAGLVLFALQIHGYFNAGSIGATTVSPAAMSSTIFIKDYS